MVVEEVWYDVVWCSTAWYSVMWCDMK